LQLPDKPIASLVKYYYHWKKTRTRSSLMDRQARKLVNATSNSVSTGAAGIIGEPGGGQMAGTSGNSSETGSDTSDSEHVDTEVTKPVRFANIACRRQHCAHETY